MNNKIEEILKSIPKNPWIYKFMNSQSKIIYIWKSVNLFNRVNSYFKKNAKLNFAKKKMVSQVEFIETILTNNETESLILETTLIKKHKPKYNILMKDDKNYLYIKITNEPIPRIIKTRQKTKSWEYFWPYLSTNYVNNILKIVKKAFWYRSCNIIFEDTKKPVPKISIKSTNWIKIPCMDFYIKRCSWPCLLKDEYIKKYLEDINNIKEFLKWDYKEIIKSLEKKMIEKAKKLEFEEAEKIKKDIESIKSLDNHQIVRDFVKWDCDIINYIEKFDKIYIWLIEIRESKITGYNNYEIENNLEEDIDFVLNTFIEQKEAENIEKNEKVIYIIPKKINNISKNLKIEIPEIWWKLDLIKLCYKNIYEYATKKYLNSLSTKWFTKKNMLNILNLLWYKQINKDILFECNDISHISWNHTVASRSIIENWKSNTSKYRKFKIKTLEEWKIDDFSSMKEVMQRRLKEVEKTNYLPDLIIIDWWKWQLSSVIKIIEEEKLKIKENNIIHEKEEIYEKKNLISLQNLNWLQIVSIAKREEELFIYINWEFQKFVLDKESLELKLIQKIRDEAHRFAITFNRDSRIKSMKKNILEQIPWIWPKTRKKILNKYWSIENLSSIKEEELKDILNKNQIDQLKNHGFL